MNKLDNLFKMYERKSGDGGNRTSYPKGIPSPFGDPVRIQNAPLMSALCSGDGGNRTRVRKTRPAEIYERSRLLLFTTNHPSGQVDLWPVARTRGSSFAQLATSCAAHRLYDARPCHRAENGAGGRGLTLGKPAVLLIAYAARGKAA